MINSAFLTIKGQQVQQEQRAHSRQGWEKGHVTSAHLGPPGAQGRRHGPGPQQQEGSGQHSGARWGSQVWLKSTPEHGPSGERNNTSDSWSTVQKQHFYVLLLELCCDLQMPFYLSMTMLRYMYICKMELNIHVLTFPFKNTKSPNQCFFLSSALAP